METAKISAALAKAQAEMQNPHMDATNPHFRSKFASLKAVRNAVIPVLAKHGISLVQELQSAERGIACITHLYCEGESLSFGPLVIPAGKADAHGFGSAATYARRYSLMAVCGIVGDEDDDANSAVAATPATITDEQAATLQAMIEETGADKAKFLAYFQSGSLAELPAAKYGSAVKMLEAKRKAA